MCKSQLYCGFDTRVTTQYYRMKLTTFYLLYFCVLMAKVGIDPYKIAVRKMF